MELVIMRHGATPGNVRRQYVGALDHPLSDIGRQQAHDAGVFPEVERVYVTSLSRTHETAAICFPNAEQIQIEGLQEMNFGVFAGRTADEMVDDADYRAWVDGMCVGRCPGGESRAESSERICAAMTGLLQRAQQAGEDRVILVAHGGTMMAAMSEFSVDHPERDYFEWHVPNCQGYRIDATLDASGRPVFDNCRRFEDLSFL